MKGVVIFLYLQITHISNAFIILQPKVISYSTREEILIFQASSSEQNTEKNEDFWAQQKALASSFTEQSEKQAQNLKKIQLEKFSKRRIGLVSDTLFYSVLIFCILWGINSSPFVALSYLFGSILGTAYSYGLGKYVETIGGSAMDSESVQGAGVGQARFAFLILLVLLSKLRPYGIQEIPSITGFFTYQIASLSQGLRQY